MEIVPNAHGTEPDINIGKSDPEETQPRPKHVTMIKTAHARVTFRAERHFRFRIEKSPDQMPESHHVLQLGEKTTFNDQNE